MLFKDLAVGYNIVVIVNTNGVLAAGQILEHGYKIEFTMRSDTDAEAYLNTISAKNMIKQCKNLVAASTPDGTNLAILVFERDILKIDLDFDHESDSFSGHRCCNLYGEILGTTGSIGSGGVFILAQQPPTGTVVEYSENIARPFQAGAKTTGLSDEDESIEEWIHVLS